MSQSKLSAKVTVDAESLFGALDSARAARGLQWRQVAKQTGISASTLTRMAQGKRPDINGFAALTAWLGNDPREFYIRGRDAPVDAVAEESDPVGTFVNALFRRNPKLTPEEREALKSLATSAFKLAKAKKPTK